METKPATGPDSTRVRAWCTQLGANTKAQGELVRLGPIINHYTQWFTDDSGKSYYSGWYNYGSYTTVNLAPV